MREILFRGKRVDNGEWQYGDLRHLKIGNIEKLAIVDNSNGLNNTVCGILVDPATVGQYTGLNNKNGKKIFEGDIMRLCKATYPCLVYWDGKGWAWKMNGRRREIDLTREKMDIIGNIHDNPELLEETE